MKTNSVKFWIYLTGLVMIISGVQGCSNGGDDDNGTRDLPIGSYSSTIYSIVGLKKDGTFTIVHVANADDPKDYTISGTFTYTVDVYDPDNDSYGKIDLTATELTINSTPTTQITGVFCDYSQDCLDPVLNVNDTMTGWWAYSSNITWGGSMRIRLNYPPNLRGADPYSGHRSLISVDPM